MVSAGLPAASGGRPAFVGRDEELEHLRGLLASAGKDGARLLLLGGDLMALRHQIACELLILASVATLSSAFLLSRAH